jgi:hypothetical protein
MKTKLYTATFAVASTAALWMPAIAAAGNKHF